MPSLFERERDLSAMMRFVRDQVAEKSRRMRFEAFDFAIALQRLRQQRFNRCARSCQFISKQLLAQFRLAAFELGQAREQGRIGRLQPHQAYVMGMRDLFADGAAFAG